MNRPRKSAKHLPPCVYFKHGAYWYVRGGKWRRLAKDLEPALEAYARIYEPARLGGMPKLLADALLDMEMRKPPLAASTLAQYRSACKTLQRKLQEFEPWEVTSDDVVTVKKELKATPTMANTCLVFLSQTFVFALEAQTYGVTGNPVTTVKRNKGGERDRLILPGEYAAIYAQADAQLQVIMDLAIRTGQRVGAIRQLERSALMDKGIRFGRHKTDGKGVVAWTPELVAVVERAKALPGAVRSIRYLFLGRDSSRPPSYSSVRRRWVGACERAGVQDAKFHDLRAVAATAAEDQGWDPQKLLLHTNPGTTRRYLRKKREPIVQGPVFDEGKDG